MIRRVLARIIAATDFRAPRWQDRITRRVVGNEITALEAELAEARVKHAGDPARIQEIERGLADLRRHQAGFSEART